MFGNFSALCMKGLYKSTKVDLQILPCNLVKFVLFCFPFCAQLWSLIPMDVSNSLKQNMIIQSNLLYMINWDKRLFNWYLQIKIIDTKSYSVKLFTIKRRRNLRFFLDFWKYFMYANSRKIKAYTDLWSQFRS